MSFISILNSLGGASPYKTDEVLFDSGIAGTYKLKILQSGTCYVEMVGGGGGGAGGFDCDGGTGAVYLGNIYIPTGDYTLQIGSGGASGNRNNNALPGTSSSISNILICGNGFGGKGYRTSGGYRLGDGGDFTILNPNLVLEPLKGKNGHGHSYNQVPSRNNSDFTPNPLYGSGGGSAPANWSSYGGNGYSGYIRITYKSKKIIKEEI